MKVETPQILWNAEEDKGINAALMSVSMTQSGLDAGDHVLVTAGTTSVLNLWSFRKAIDYLCSLTRHEGPVNAVAFSPDGLHLATAGDAGAIIVWSVPPSKRGNGHGRHFWSTVTREQELAVQIVARVGEAVCDLSWSSDSRRFVAGTIDHAVICVEYQQVDWKVVWRNGMEHTHFVQGVAYDPLGVYLASMSSDRSVRVFTRKDKPKLEILNKTKKIKYHTVQGKKQHLFADESTLQSFVRRLDWTPDGAYLIVPAALWHGSFATLIYARHLYHAPCRVWTGLARPSVAVRANPILWKVNESKENATQPYRSIVAVLTHDAVLLYDTTQAHPLAIVTDIHYANLVDAAWTADGRTLLVASSDGYITVIRFAQDELGSVFQPTPATVTTETTTQTPVSPTTSSLPPCEPGPAAVAAPPAKKLKPSPNAKRPLPEIEQLSIKEKKRITPTLIQS